jgi:hypothetical protein
MLLFPEAACPQTYEQHAGNLCMPRQMAALLQRDLNEVCDSLKDAEHRFLGTDTLERGRTSRVILQLCSKPILAWTVHEGHCYFYSTPQVRRSLLQRRVGAVTKMRKVQKATSTLLADEWLPWAKSLKQGHYRVDEEEFNEVQKAQGRNVQVLMKDSSRPRALLYRMTRVRDGATGMVHIHGLPQL